MLEKIPGTLYVVATPIGNLQDITYRAVEILKCVDKILAEDTRHAAPLLKHLSIRQPVVSLHDFNERERLDQYIKALAEGAVFALISDAGTPLISDPGFRLVRAAKQAGIIVIPVPGACALIAALSAAGLPTDRFVFEGFLPAKDKARENDLVRLSKETRTLIFYEAPHRLLACLKSMTHVFGADRQACVARELTKMHESVKLDTLAQLVAYYEATPEAQRGEVVILVAGEEPREEVSNSLHSEDVLRILLAELSLKQAVSLAAKLTGQRKNTLYELALTLVEK